MELYQWILLYVAASLGFGVLWATGGVLLIVGFMRVIIWPLLFGAVIWLLAGCVVAKPHAPKNLAQFQVTTEQVTVCIVNVDADAIAIMRNEGLRFGLDVVFRPLPSKYAFEPERRHEYDDGAKAWGAQQFIRVNPDCPIIVRQYGGGGACLAASIFVPVPCELGLTYAKRQRLDAVIILRLASANIVRHEFLHALGCAHEDDDATCSAQIALVKQRLRES